MTKESGIWFSVNIVCWKAFSSIPKFEGQDAPFLIVLALKRMIFRGGELLALIGCRKSSPLRPVWRYDLLHTESECRARNNNTLVERVRPSWGDCKSQLVTGGLKTIVCLYKCVWENKHGLIILRLACFSNEFDSSCWNSLRCLPGEEQVFSWKMSAEEHSAPINFGLSLRKPVKVKEFVLLLNWKASLEK